MKHNYFSGIGKATGLLVGLWLLATTAWAQAPAWVLATAGSSAALNSSKVQATTTDANGNVLVTGSFTGQLVLGSTALTSAGQTDLFIAKYSPATNTWVWAVRGGGTSNDYGNGIASSGNSVYITGTIDNNLANARNVTFASSSAGAGTAVQLGASTNPVGDLVVAKYTDQGTSAVLGWTQVGGGSDGSDQGTAIAVNGNSVYVLGIVYGNTANTQQVTFGGAGTTPGTLLQVGISSFGSTDWVLAKYLDQGSSATVAWTQVGGGQGTDYAYALAASGTSIYATGAVYNDLANGGGVAFGGTNTTLGTAAQYGASATISFDLAVVKYVDQGSSATVAWTQGGGGTGPDVGNAIAVRGANVYVTGTFFNDLGNSFAVVLGGSGATPGTLVQYGAARGSIDFLLLKYTDSGTSATLGWTQIGGGSSSDNGFGVAVGSTGNDVYVAGRITTDAANTNGVVFGGTGATPGTVAVAGTGTATNGNLLVAKFLDNGATGTLSWTQTGGGDGEDQGVGIALSGNRLYVGGIVVPPATFGSLTVNAPTGTNRAFLGGLDLSASLATTPAAAARTPRLYPNPAPGPATLSGAGAGAVVLILDALGRCVATATADARGTAALPGGLRPGVYVVRAGAGTARWVVE